MRAAAVAVGPLLLILAAINEAATHESFVPLVAFECGYRNRYMHENGSWISDENRYATCMSGKEDILKYCKKSYSKLNVSNIVEYAHEVTLADWCREEGDKCHYTETVRPYRCIVGEFHSEALQVPHDCRFNHENGNKQCNDYDHWRRESARLCAAKDDGTGKKQAVRSFAMLEPCGLDLFSGVEFVCCPALDEVSATASSKDVKKELESDEDSDEGYDEDEEDDSDEDDSDEDSSKPVTGRDSYFTQNALNLGTEHENYKEALDRQDEKHRTKVAKVMREWNELDARYAKMKKTDPKGAESFKAEMTNRFQATVASLEEENRKARKEIEEVHEERVESQLNERKRVSTHAYRKALADYVTAPTNKNEVLKTLKTYIRSEEKDRIHTITRFRHLLKSDLQDAMDKKGLIIHRLRYVDLRVNGTIAMLRDFPALEEQIRPIVLAFWQDFRNENSPDLTLSQKKELDKVLPELRDEKMIQMFEEDFRKEHPKAFDKIRMPAYPSPMLRLQAPSSSAAPATTATNAKVLPADDEVESEEESDQYYEDENDEEIRKKVPKKEVEKETAEQKQAEEKIWLKPLKVEMKTTKKEEKEAIVKPAPKNPVKDDDTEDSSESIEDDDDDDDVKDDEDEKDLDRQELKIAIEPIIEDKSMHVPPAFYRQERLSHRSDNLWPFTASGYLCVFVGVLFSVFITFMVVGMRNRRHHIRFVEVDVCSPEERHVNGMQVNGYENPTYSFFDAKP